jgi:hypothetical protein
LTKYLGESAAFAYILLRRRTGNRSAKVEKAPDTESGFQKECFSRAKQPIAGTAEVGGQRRGHPKLIGEGKTP